MWAEEGAGWGESLSLWWGPHRCGKPRGLPMCALLGLSGLCGGTDHMLSWPCLCLAVSALLRELARDSV